MRVKFSTVHHKRGCIFNDDPIPLEGVGEVAGAVRVDAVSCFIIWYKGLFIEVPIRDCSPVIK